MKNRVNWRSIACSKDQPMKRRNLKIILVALGLPVGIFILAALAIVASGLKENIQQADLAVVLGTMVKRNGMPTARLWARVAKSAELYHQGLVANILVSGSAVKGAYDEAQVMKHILLEQGIPEKAIYTDDQGDNTYLTAQNTARLMREKHWKSVMVVSQYYHLPRARLAFKRFHLSPVYSAKADLSEMRDFYAISREVLGYGYYLARRYP